MSVCAVRRLRHPFGTELIARREVFSYEFSTRVLSGPAAARPAPLRPRSAAAKRAVSAARPESRRTLRSAVAVRAEPQQRLAWSASGTAWPPRRPWRGSARVQPATSSAPSAVSGPMPGARLRVQDDRGVRARRPPRTCTPSGRPMRRASSCRTRPGEQPHRAGPRGLEEPAAEVGEAGAREREAERGQRPAAEDARRVARGASRDPESVAAGPLRGPAYVSTARPAASRAMPHGRPPGGEAGASRRLGLAGRPSRWTCRRDAGAARRRSPPRR
ncbi:hypothetical protein SALBM135S_07390 [Streptomyces alboniger]